MIPFSLLNDFIFCPYSIYFHNIYKSYNNLLYTDILQIKGKNNHQTIEKKSYKKKNWIENFPLSSERYLVYGFADLFNIKEKIIFERKLKIKNNLFLGQKMQLVAQYLCFKDIGISIKKIKVLSQNENKIYTINIPNQKDIDQLKKLVEKIINFNLDSSLAINKNKCKNCIYKNWCYKYAQSS